MVGFVLDDAGGEAGMGFCLRFAVGVCVAERDMGVAGDGGAEAGDGEAAFPAEFLLVR